jgi:hypothetical protein
MSNRNDSDFDFDDDLFGSDNDSTFGGGDDDLNFDDDALGLTGDDLNFDDDLATQERRGPSRAFVILAVIIIILFLVGLGGVIFFATRNTGPSDRDFTATAIVQLNFTQEAFLAATNTQSAANQEATATAAVLGETATAVAFANATLEAEILLTQVAFEATQTAEFIPTETPEPTLTPTLDDVGGTLAAEQTLAALPPVAQITAQFQTQEAQTTLVAQTAVVATRLAQETAAALQPPTATNATGPSFSEVSDVLQTATALSLTLNPQTAIPATPDPSSPSIGTPFIVPTTVGTGTGTGTGSLPNTGLFEDLTGANGFGTMALIAVGLIGLIFGARRLRK